MTDATAGEAQPVDFGDERAAAEWPLRPWLLAGLLGLAGLLIYLATDGHEDEAGRAAPAAFLLFGSIAAAFTLEQGRWKAPSLFALLIGLVMAGLAWRAVQYGDFLPDEQYGFAAGVVASALALPLFQAGFVTKRLGTSYTDLHYHVWTDAISVAGALAFTGLSWVVLALLSELFVLLKIDVLHKLMDEGWFGWTYSGLAAGAALGTLRNQLKVLGTLQTVVLLVLSLLAVPLAVGLLVFLLATAISGPQVLWDATRSATPLLLACAAGAWVLASAIVRYEDEAMSRSRIMRLAALVLAAVILPLAVFAAVSMGLRLDQYGLAPERLWGLAAIVVACAYGVGFWGALARGRRSGWAAHIRQANFHLGLFVCGLAVLLALPILDFGAISTRDQVARLEKGAVTPDEFDFAALRWDFGEPGQRALRRLAKSGNARVAELAQSALAQTERSYYGGPVRAAEDYKLRVQPDDPELRRLVLDYLRSRQWLCQERCVALDLGKGPAGERRVAIVQGGTYQVATLKAGTPGTEASPTPAAYDLLKDSSQVEIREVTRRFIFVDGKPLPQPIDDAATPLEAEPPPR